MPALLKLASKGDLVIDWGFVMKIVYQTNIDAYPLLARGKVRDIYEIDARTLLIVTTDRMSAFDVLLAEPVPYKGVILNQLTLFWMAKFDSIVPNHILESDVAAFPAKLKPWQEELAGRAVIARKGEPLPFECICRGYLAGSAWQSYLKTGEVCGHKLPAGMAEAQKLPEALFTPSTKAAAGLHDQNICFAEMEAIVGDQTAQKARLVSLDIYNAGQEYAAGVGIIVADTKFEFGYIDGTLHLIDEVLTPDSSRFWPEAGYEPGKAQPSFDKQFLRDWLNKQPWNHEPPAPKLPEDIIKATADRYYKAYELLTGKKFSPDA